MSSFTRLIIFLALCIISCTSQPEPELHIYLCFGQSNMEGTGPIEPQDTAVNNRFFKLEAMDCPDLGRVKGEWNPAIPPLCHCSSGLSPADYFGRTMVDSLPEHISVGVLNVAVGGCDIRLFDKDLYQDHDSTYVENWFLDKVKSYDGNPYNRFITLAKEAKHKGEIKGILLHQGETNTGDSLWPQYVHKIYNDILSDLSLEAENVPLIAQDHAHFDAEGYREFGRRYAWKMLEIGY